MTNTKKAILIACKICNRTHYISYYTKSWGGQNMPHYTNDAQKAIAYQSNEAAVSAIKNIKNNLHREFFTVQAIVPVENIKVSAQFLKELKTDK